MLDQAGSFTIGTSSAAGADVQLVDPDDLPDGLTFMDNGDGTATVSGTPLTAGTANVTIVATGVLGASSVQVVTLNVASAVTSNVSTTFLSGPSATFVVDQASNFVVRTVAIPGEALELDTALPAGLTYSDNGNGTGTISGVPLLAATGVALTFTAASAEGVRSGTLVLAVEGLDATESTAVEAAFTTAPAALVTGPGGVSTDRHVVGVGAACSRSTRTICRTA